MCFKLNLDHDSLPFISCASQLYQPILDLRNGSDEMGCLETFARRVAGELCFAGLTVAVVVEQVFRFVLAIVLIPFTLLHTCCVEDSEMIMMLFQLPAAPVFIVEHVVRNVNALVQNIYKARIEINDLNCCQLADLS
jgi:hypothetical protein